MEYQNATKCIHLEENENIEKAFGAVSFPIYQTATFAHKGVGESTGYDYSRMQNPTREQLEKTVAALEKGIDAIGFSSGMAAVTAVMELFVPGDHVIIDADLYGGSVRLFQNISAKNGIVFSRVDLSREEVSGYITERTKAVFLETPTNPMMHVIDLKKLSEITRQKEILLIVDNTFLSPYFQNPLDMGADIVIHSGTKYLNGHNDAIAGFAVVKDEKLKEKLRYIYKTVGSCLSPFDSWLILRGIKTLAVRMEKAQENAFLIAGWLKEQRQVKKVFYPGLPEHPGYDIMKKQSRGYGAMISFEVEDRELARRILNKVHLIQFAESLGGVETLITYPIMQTHADVPKEELAENGITDALLRISVGIEDGRDLLADLEQAFRFGGQ
ncbi:MAG: PLP-dependent aspartate aminotransferase family protein [Lachnospiraceae bacterium]|nr:PLP-dependent aspartate aminotransferase family protein [Lachnospiraceae bacterium]